MAELRGSRVPLCDCLPQIFQIYSLGKGIAMANDEIHLCQFFALLRDPQRSCGRLITC